ncbi:hypothetical protein, partial [Klebsiella michiganensis]|uniref:hypothetical protein n=1 Tax=Klebsiella michiganensis TaxID=1134687 RepID=UPI000B1C693D
VLPENPASYRGVRTKSYLFNKAEQILKTSGGTSVIIKGNHVQVIYGLGVNKIRNAVNRYLDVHE